jgi:hypothetical protein
LIDRAKPVEGYTQFVQARVWRTQSQPDLEKIADILTTAYADFSKSPPLAAAGGRRSREARPG